MIQAKENEALELGSSYGDEEGWSDSGNTLKVEPSGFLKEKQRGHGWPQSI